MASSGMFASFFAASSFHVAIAESTSPGCHLRVGLSELRHPAVEAVGARALHDLVELRDGALLLPSDASVVARWYRAWMPA